MIPPDLTTLRASKADPALREALLALVGFGVRIAQVAAEVAEAEARIVAIVTSGLPTGLADAGSLAEAQQSGLVVDAADLALAQASPRIAAASQSFERVSRAVRRTAALVQRLDTGWPRWGGSDDRHAMARRHVARSVGEMIARQAQGEAAERLFDDLGERLDALEMDGGLDRPAEELIAAICRDLGLTRPEPAADGKIRASPRTPPEDSRPLDT